ncbi:MAG: hypothetical protein AAB553_08045 [Patescibacteria group bacterium]
MLTIIHGDDTASSRKFFLQQKEQFPDALLWEGDKVTITDLAQIFSGGALFEESKTLFVEQLLTKQKRKSEYEALITTIQEYGKENTIVLWEGKELDRSMLQPFTIARIQPFKLPQSLFQLLDSLRPGNGKNLIKLLHQTIETTEGEMVFFMLIRQVRLLLALSSAPIESPIDEIKRMQPWQKSKLEQQAKLFTINQLKDLYHKLFTIESKQKTGKLALPLIPTIDFLLLEV